MSKYIAFLRAIKRKVDEFQVRGQKFIGCVRQR